MPISPPSACEGPSCNKPTHGKYCEDCRKKNTKVYLVVGPPASGKTTFVRDRAKRGDLIIDVDLIYMAVSNAEMYDKPRNILPFVLAARDEMISKIGLMDHVRAAWIIHSKISDNEAKKMADSMGAEIVELRVPSDVCKARAASDPNRTNTSMEEWNRLIDEWYAHHPVSIGYGRGASKV